MKEFPQYKSDMQDFVRVLFELNALDRRKAAFLSSVGYTHDERHTYWDRLAGTPMFDDRKQLFKQEQALAARWNTAIKDLLQKGYTAEQLPSRVDLDNYYDWRSLFVKRAV